MRKYRNGKKSLRSKGDDKYSEEYLGYRIGRGSLSIKTKLVDTDSNGEKDTILKSWRSPSVGKVQEYASSTTPTPPFDTKPSYAPTGIDTLLSPIESPVSISTFSSPLFAPASIGVLASPQGVPTGISTLQSPRFQPTDISISTVDFVAPPSTEPTDIDTLLSPQLPPTNIQTELQATPPTTEPTDINTLASPQSAPTGIATLTSPQSVPTGIATLASPQSPPTNIQAEIEVTNPPVFEPTNIQIALDNDGDGVFIPADEDDNNRLITEPLIDMSVEDFTSELNLDSGEGFMYMTFGPFANTEKSTVTANVSGSTVTYARQYGTVNGSRYIIINDDGTVTGHARGTDSNGNYVFTHQTDLGVLSGDVIGSSMEISNRSLDGTSSFIQNIVVIRHVETITASEWESLLTQSYIVRLTDPIYLGSTETTTGTIALGGGTCSFYRRYATSQQSDGSFVYLHFEDDLTCTGYIAETNSSGERYFTKQANLGTISNSGFSSGVSFNYMTASFGDDNTGTVSTVVF